MSTNPRQHDIGRWGLLHDAAEAYLMDLPRALKYSPSLDGYRVLEARVEKMIFGKFGLTGPKPEVVKYADQMILRAEALEFGILTHEWDVYKLPKCGIIPEGWEPHDAEAIFLEHARDLGVA